MKEHEQDCGLSSLESFAHYDHDTHCWKTSQVCLVSGLEEFSGTWPKSGMMRNGKCYLRPSLERGISEGVSLLLPTPTSAQDRTLLNAQKWEGNVAFRANGKPYQATVCGVINRNIKSSPELFPENTIINGRLNPEFSEWLMGFPTGHTDIEQPATPSPPPSPNTLED